MDEKVVIFMKKSSSEFIVNELKDIDFVKLGAFVRVLSDDNFDEYMKSVEEWEKMEGHVDGE